MQTEKQREEERDVLRIRFRSVDGTHMVFVSEFSFVHDIVPKLLDNGILSVPKKASVNDIQIRVVDKTGRY